MTVNALFWFEVPPVLRAHCEHWGAGYSLQIVWNKPPGIWTAVEVNVSGKTLRTGDQGQQYVTVSGFQPATTYQVSLAALSGAVRRSEPFAFQCLTDPRGESSYGLVCFTQSKQWSSGLTERQVCRDDWCFMIPPGRSHFRLGDCCGYHCCPGRHRCRRVLQETRYYQVGSASVADLPSLNVLIRLVSFHLHNRRKLFSSGSEQLNKKPT